MSKTILFILLIGNLFHVKTEDTDLTDQRHKSKSHYVRKTAWPKAKMRRQIQTWKQARKQHLKLKPWQCELSKKPSDIRCYGRVSVSCSACGTRRIAHKLVKFRQRRNQLWRTLNSYYISMAICETDIPVMVD